MGSYVGIDLHRRHSVVVVLNETGDRVSWSRIDNSPAELARELTAAGPDAEVTMEATWGHHPPLGRHRKCPFRHRSRVLRGTNREGSGLVGSYRRLASRAVRPSR